MLSKQAKARIRHNKAKDVSPEVKIQRELWIRAISSSKTGGVGGVLALKCTSWYPPVYQLTPRQLAEVERRVKKYDRPVRGTDGSPTIDLASFVDGDDKRAAERQRIFEAAVEGSRPLIGVVRTAQWSVTEDGLHIGGTGPNISITPYERPQRQISQPHSDILDKLGDDWVAAGFDPVAAEAHAQEHQRVAAILDGSSTVTADEASRLAQENMGVIETDEMSGLGASIFGTSGRY